MGGGHISLRVWQVGLAGLYAAILIAGFRRAPSPMALVGATALGGFAFVTGKTLPDVAVAPAIAVRAVGIGLLVAVAAMWIVAKGSISQSGSVVAVLGYCIGNRSRAAIDMH